MRYVELLDLLKEMGCDYDLNFRIIKASSKQTLPRKIKELFRANKKTMPRFWLMSYDREFCNLLNFFIGVRKDGQYILIDPIEIEFKECGGLSDFLYEFSLKEAYMIKNQLLKYPATRYKRSSTGVST